MKNIVLILSSVLLNCGAQLLIRKGMLLVGDITTSATGFLSRLPAMASNLYLWGAMGSYAVSIILWMAVLGRVDVSFAYPFLSIGYIVALFAGWLIFGENVSPIRIAGVVVIALGVILISRS